MGCDSRVETHMGYLVSLLAEKTLHLKELLHNFHMGSWLPELVISVSVIDPCVHLARLGAAMYLATGCPILSLHYEFLLGIETVRGIDKDICEKPWYGTAAEASLNHQIFKPITHEKFKQAIERDDTLNGVKILAKKGDRYFFKDGLIYRRALNKSDDAQTIVPTKFREIVLKICHDVPSAGYMGVSATKKRVGSRFSWPKMMSDVSNYIRSCHSCQIYARRLFRLPIEQCEIISRPFDKISIAGPMNLTRSRNRFILTMVDATTRWPEAIPLKGINTREVAEALFGIFSRLSIPKQVLSDNGKRFVSNAMQEAMTMMGVERIL
ncbi:gypsy retrotransposon integrase 1-like protein [Plakobranchus ocellatus]|uniref:Gypsy retrotransposon integrase 1-like protein n=1 Tax=Plakobranchus ocellatus TaxID=259542 RepID=A0AAV3Z3B6_9GAST|nr:gypsy retrotransposon integrase 1-like protein [Plakobranchus ocellatus]